MGRQKGDAWPIVEPMIYVGTESEARRHRRAVRMPDGVEMHKAEWMDSGRDQRLSPTVFLVEHPPNYTVPTHFHRHNEYQVVVHGEGKLGAHELRPISVHYAGAYTGYGPLVAGPTGLHYFTLRAVFDPGPLYIVENRDQLRRGPKLQRYGERCMVSSQEFLEKLTTVHSLDIIDATDDGGAVRLIHLPPGATTEIASAQASAGQFLMVLAGVLVHNGRELKKWETVFLSQDEAPQRVAADIVGAQVLSMRLPPMAQAYCDAA